MWYCPAATNKTHGNGDSARTRCSLRLFASRPSSDGRFALSWWSRLIGIAHLWIQTYGLFLLASLVAEEAAPRERKSSLGRARDAGEKSHKGCRTTGALVLCLLLAIVCGTSRAAEPVYDIEIPSLNAAEALNRFAEQTGAIMLFPYDLASARQANAVSGRYTLLEGLDLLLQGTGLSGGLSDKRVVSISLRGDEQRNEREGDDMAREKKGILAGVASAVLSVLTAQNAGGQEAAEAQSMRDTPVLEEMTVTGSRIARSPLSTTTPTLAVDAEMIERSGFNNLSDIMLRLPAVAAGIGASTVNYSADAGASFIDLRGLGVNRTLTLIDGRRRVAGTHTSSAVDLSAIPAALVERIEIVTGGASAVYGADAVTGVVNVILKSNFEGLEASGRAGISKYGDGNSYSMALTAGTTFGDTRGHISFGLNYTQDDPIFLRDRPFSKQNPTTFPNPANTGPDDGIPDVTTLENWRVRDISVPGTFIVDGVAYLVDPELRLRQNDQGFGIIGIGGDGFTNVPYNPLRIGLKTISGLTDFEYEIGRSVDLFAQLSFAQTQAHDPRQPMSDRGLVVQRDNPFVPASVQALMDAHGLMQIEVGRSQLDLGIQFNDIDRTTYTVLTGIEGDVGRDWGWQLTYQYGLNDYTSGTYSRNQERFLQSIDVVTDPATSQAVCRSPDARAAGCVPLSIIGRDVATPAALDWIMHTRVRSIDTEQQITGIQLKGDLFSMPAGPLEFVAGAEHRKESLSSQDDGLAITGKLFRLDNGGPPIDASFDVSEAFVELVAPLAEEARFAHLLEVEAAARYSSYSTIGDTVAWKLGGVWAPVEDLRFRITRSRSVRAPSLNELFSPGINGLINIVDPCDASQISANPNRVENCAALGLPAGYVDPRPLTARTVTTGGNPDLEEESSDSWTVGLVLTPRWLDRFSLSVDYWSIELGGAVESIGAQQLIDLCVDSTSIDNAFCGAISRIGDNSIEVVRTSPINVGRLEAAGVDFQARYHLFLDQFGKFNGDIAFGVTGTRLLDLREIVNPSDPNSVIVRSGGIRAPTWRGNLFANYALGTMEVSWTMRYIDDSRIDPSRPLEYFDRPVVSARSYHDLHSRYQFTDNVDLFLGVNNLFNEMPPATSQTYQGVGEGALYDNIGRFFFVGGAVRF